MYLNREIRPSCLSQSICKHKIHATAKKKWHPGKTKLFATVCRWPKALHNCLTHKLTTSNAGNVIFCFRGFQWRMKHILHS